MNPSALRREANLPLENIDPAEGNAQENQTAAWKQEVNQRLAAHRTRKSTPDAQASVGAETSRAAGSRAAQAAARVAARYAKAPSYSELLAGEARAVVRAAGAAAEAARHAQAAAQAVLTGLEMGQEWGHALPEPVAKPAAQPPTQPLAESRGNKERMEFPARGEEAQAAIPQSRWLDEPPAASVQTAQFAQGPWPGAQPRWEEALPVSAHERDVWTEMRLHPASQPAEESDSRYDLNRDSHRDSRYDMFADADLGEPLLGESFDFPEANDLVGNATVEPVQHIPANLIEFPRELIATRKARPRLAEGPFAGGSRAETQLNIFEVDPELLAPPVVLGASERVAPPEWASIELDHPAEYEEFHAEPALQSYTGQAYADTTRVEQAERSAVEYRNAAEEAPVAVSEAVHADAYGNAGALEWHDEAAYGASAAVAEPPAREQRIRTSVAAPAAEVDVELVVARISDRALAAVVDGALVTLATVAAGVVVIASTAHPPAGRIALVAVACGWMIFALIYQFLFFSFAEEGTPGMRYARIALCTFEDDNPTPRQMLQRIPGMILSALPAGLGLLWAVWDREHLSWHDRMTRTYQRKY